MTASTPRPSRPGVVKLTIDGGAGNDTILGSHGADTIFGGDGNDIVTGGRGNDTALLGAGDDTFAGTRATAATPSRVRPAPTRSLFNGANVAEKIDISANGPRVRFTRDVGSITMDLNGVEQINFNALGGADTITVNDLTGTGVTQVNIDLAGSGRRRRRCRPTRVIVNGTGGDDTINISGRRRRHHRSPAWPPR